MSIHWRDSMRSARLFSVDARAAFPFLLVLIHLKTWTLILALISTIAFWIAERLGLRFEAALRAARAWFVIPFRPAQAFQLNRRSSDMSGVDGITPPMPTPPPATNKPPSKTK